MDSPPPFLIFLYALGMVGLFGFTLLLIRIWQLVFLKELLAIFRASKPLAALSVALGLAIPFYVYLWASVLKRLSGCLTQGVCGGDRAAGLILMAIFGGYYAIFEAGLALTRFWYSRHARNLTSRSRRTPSAPP